MNAKPRDLQAGWGIYRASGFKAELAEVNEKLVARGFNSISGRSYRHYEKLARYGYERYVPINRLDVETLRDPVWGTPLTSSYRARETEVAVDVVLVHENDVVTFAGVTSELSETAANVSVTGKGPVQLLLADPSNFEGLHCLIHLGNVAETRSAVIEVVEPNAEHNAAQLMLGFLELVPTPEVTGRLVLDPASLTIRINSEDSEYFVNTVRVLHALFQAVDSARVVCDEVLVQLDRDQRYVLPPPTLSTLSKSSPLLVEFGGAWPPLAVFSAVVLLYVRWWKGHNDGRLSRKQGDYVGTATQHLAEQTRSLRLKNDLVEFRSSLLKEVPIRTYIIEKVQEALPETHDISEIDEERLESLIERQLLPAVEQLFDEQLEEVELETDREMEEPSLPDDLIPPEGAREIEGPQD